MHAILSVTVPFFALVLCGYLAARTRVMPTAAIPGLNAFVLFFALPCMLFRFGAATPLANLLSPAMLGLYAVTGLCIVAATIVFTLGARVHLKDAAFGALVAAFPNTGFMGMPMMTALLGTAAAGPMMVTLLADMFIVSSVCLAIAQMHGAGHLPLGARLRNALRGPAGNPQPWAIALGALSSATGLMLPGPLDRIVELLAAAATPVALFTIGAVLARARMQEIAGDARAMPRGDYLPVALLKLLLHPLLLLAVGSAAVALGLSLRPETLVTLVLVAALPSASNVSMLAERFGANNGRIARIILVSTMLAFFSFPALVSLVAGAR